MFHFTAGNHVMNFFFEIATEFRALSSPLEGKSYDSRSDQ